MTVAPRAAVQVMAHASSRGLDDGGRYFQSLSRITHLTMIVAPTCSDSGNGGFSSSSSGNHGGYVYSNVLLCICTHILV